MSRDLEERLQALVDGELDETEAREVLEMVAGDEDARRRLASLERLTEAARRLPTRVEPPRDLWPEIRQRLEPRGVLALLRPLRSSPWRLAAAAVLCMALGSLLTLWLVPRARAPVPEASDAVVLSRQAPRPEPLELVGLERSFLYVRRSLVETLERQRPHLFPQTVAVVEENLRIIDRAIVDISLALEEKPGDSELNLLLAATYQKEVELLHLLNRLPTSS